MVTKRKSILGFGSKAFTDEMRLETRKRLHDVLKKHNLYFEPADANTERAKKICDDLKEASGWTPVGNKPNFKATCRDWMIPGYPSLPEEKSLLNLNEYFNGAIFPDKPELLKAKPKSIGTWDITTHEAIISVSGTVASLRIGLKEIGPNRPY